MTPLSNNDTNEKQREKKIGYNGQIDDGGDDVKSYHQKS